MKIEKIDKLKDGGSTVIYTDDFTYHIDQRLNTVTPNEIYRGYPGEKGTKVAENSEARDLVVAIVEYHLTEKHKKNEGN